MRLKLFIEKRNEKRKRNMRNERHKKKKTQLHSKHGMKKKKRKMICELLRFLIRGTLTRSYRAVQKLPPENGHI